MTKIKYSKVALTKTITREDGTEIIYAAKKLSPFTISLETAKLAKQILPSIGMGVDSKDTGQMWGRVAMVLQDKLSDEYLEHLQDMFFAELYLGSVETSNQISEDYWDENFEDFWEVFYWLFKENIINFTLGNGMFRSLKESLAKMVNLESLDEVIKILQK